MVPNESNVNAQRQPFAGEWRIVQMELWDRDYLDLEGPARIVFESDRLGAFQFGAVRGWIDYRLSNDGGSLKADFSWEGSNDSDRACGRGWAAIADDRLVGRLYVHNGDDSGFIAERQSPSSAGRSRSSRSGA